MIMNMLFLMYIVVIVIHRAYHLKYINLPINLNFIVIKIKYNILYYYISNIILLLVQQTDKNMNTSKWY